MSEQARQPEMTNDDAPERADLSRRSFLGRLGLVASFGLAAVAAAWLGWALGGRGVAGVAADGRDDFGSIVLPVLDGERDGPGLRRGQISVLDFWATWCAPCRAQAKILDQVAEEFEARGVSFFAIDVGEPEDLVRESVMKDPYPYPVLLDETGDVSAQFGIEMLPTVVVVDADGDVALFKAGITGRTKLTSVLNELLSRSETRQTAASASAVPAND